MAFNLLSGALLRLDNDRVCVLSDLIETTQSEAAHLVVRQFYDSQMTQFSAGSQQILSVVELRRQLAAVAAKGLAKSTFSNLDRTSFSVVFDSILSRIQREEITKAVASQVCVGPSLSEGQLAHHLLHLLNCPETLQVFGFWHRGVGVIGATPEILFKKTGETVQSMALAGSAAIGQQENLIQDPKQQHEHELVVIDIQNRLQQFGRVTVGTQRVLALPRIEHLCTDLFLTGSLVPDTELINALHPTPALGVAPREKGIEWMQTLPGQVQRGYFGAPILFRVGPDQSVCLVMIRSLFFSPTLSQLWVGCGLVKASQKDHEFAELTLKLQSTMQALGFSDG